MAIKVEYSNWQKYFLLQMVPGRQRSFLGLKEEESLIIDYD